MISNKELKKIRKEMTWKRFGKFAIYTVVAVIIFFVFVDGIFNDEIANFVSEIDRSTYYIFVRNKKIVLISAVFMIIVLNFFILLRKSDNDLMVILDSMDQISKNPDDKVKLPDSLYYIESKLNEIRIELVKTRDKAKEEEEKKNDLIMYMAHDIKTPLTSTIGYLSLLLDEKDIIEKATREKYIQIALKKALRVEELTNQFFEITRYNLHDMHISKERINLSILLEQLIDECYPMLQEKRLECRMNHNNNIYINGDGDKLARAFENLLKNAINYSFDNSCIELTVKENENNIEMEFKNKGEKIPEYKLQKLFEPFFRADEARTSKTGGSGLGLAITKEIIELHNGTINVKNDDDYIRFYIELPKNNY